MPTSRTILIPWALGWGLATVVPAQSQAILPALEQEVRARTTQIEAKLIAWRRDIHQNPELGEQETRTAGLVAAHLTKLGLDVRTGVGRTGVVAVLNGTKPGPVVALRADMDALPVKEPDGLPFVPRRNPSTSGVRWTSCTPADTTHTLRS